MKRPVAIDLFAGCGGLSLGLRAAGFDVRVAVEIDQVSAATYRTNHPETELIEQDIREVTSPELLATCDGSPVALVAGCAPCQGFCSLTAKNGRDDPRNELVLHMARLIKGVRPLAVMMENVPGLETRGSSIFHEFVKKLKTLGYEPEWRIVQMADYGVPQSRRRLVLFAGRGFRIPFPEPTHSKQPTPRSGLPKWLTLRDVIGHMPDPVTVKEARASGGPRMHNWHVVRDLQPQVARRLEVATPGKTWRTVNESVRPQCHRNGYDGFTNTYGRMSWDQTPVTMTAGCTTPCKGRFGHPDKHRTTISVREAALIQTFPEEYVFETDYMDQVSQLIGNAVPPVFAYIAGRQLRTVVAAVR
jgi:DNA (cytosine-5)-methyltransferase 1